MPPIANDGSLALWRGIEDFSTEKDFGEYFHREFPKEASIWAELETESSRREFLKLMGASLALAGVSACTKMPAEKIFPYPIAGQERLEQNRHFYASSSIFRGYAKGILVESHQGRPTKIEGNALHPASLGTSDIFTQAEILRLYDPMRSKAVIHRGEVSSWDAFEKKIGELLPEWQKSQGQGLRFLTGTVTSPTLDHQMQSILKLLPKAKWHSYEAVNQDIVFEGTTLAFGKNLSPIYYFDRARVIVSLDADFLAPGIAQQAYARAFIKNRKIDAESVGENLFCRLYMVDSSVSTTGSVADHRITLKPSQVLKFALALANKMGISFREKVPEFSNNLDKKIELIAAELLANASQSIVIAGEQQNPSLQAITHAINARLGNHGKTIEFISPPESNGVNKYKSLEELSTDLAQNKVSALIILGNNPAYATPANLDFAKVMANAPLKVYFGLYQDETSYLCEWQLPESHFLESWGDAKAFDGTISLQQPLISPLYDTRTASELLAIFLNTKEKSSYDILKHYWTNFSPMTISFEKCVHEGLIPNTRSSPVKLMLKNDWQDKLFVSAAENKLEINFRPDPTVWDGTYANNAWLQELPKPVLQLCWDNAALISPKTAQLLKLRDEDRIELRVRNSAVEAPVLIVPGHPNDTVTAFFGYGRTRAGIGTGKGYNAYEIFDGKSFIANLEIRKKNTSWTLARTHRHHSMEGRDIVRRGSLKEYLKDPSAIVPKSAKEMPLTLLAKRSLAPKAWAMVIDLNSCIGCNTCTIACQAENNIPIVGKEQVLVSREMHWIRVDRYYEGSLENPKTFFQPVPCMQCEKAPCELVCPTVATNHSGEGLNQMVYNRCVGTRYCSNNCPYKVRRFNFLQYTDMTNPSIKLMRNPQVTVRSRGVMEKCTYCTQRIESARIEAQKENRNIKDGEIVPACAQACPTEAIIFGDKNDPKSRVAQLIKNPLNYSVLNELGAVPRTTYLAKLSQENPRWKKEV